MFHFIIHDYSGVIFLYISKVKNCMPQKLKSCTKYVAATIFSALPVRCGVDTFVKELQKDFPRVEVSIKNLSESLTQGLDVIENVNCRGGLTKAYSDSALFELRTKFSQYGIKTDYTQPIDTMLRPYIPSTGQFGSLRHQGRAHLGIDIYPRLYGRKPKEPVPVLSVSDGIVVSVKKSPDKDPKNLIANNIKIMSPDGKIYSYDHLGRPEDYKGAKYTPLKPLGSIVLKGDTLGTVGKTGETDVWHLHFGVEDLDEKVLQQKNKVWQKLFKNYSVYAIPRGQVDPLNRNKAGCISEILNKYRLDKGEKVPYLNDL